MFVGISYAHPPYSALDFGRALHGGPNANVRSAPAQVTGERRIDVGVGGVCVPVDECRRAHQLAGLAVATLRHVELRPGLLHGVIARVGCESLDRPDGLSRERPNRDGAGADWRAFHMNRTGA